MKTTKPKKQRRQSESWFDKPEGFDSWPSGERLKYRMEENSKFRESPYQRAKEKVEKFVGECVTDPDFRHHDSAALLDLLLIVRDQLLSDNSTSATKKWSLDDYLQPILDAALAHSRRIKEENGKDHKSAMKAAQEHVVGEWGKVDNKRAHREQFADRMAQEISEKFGVEKSAAQIRKSWLKGP